LIWPSTALRTLIGAPKLAPSRMSGMPSPAMSSSRSSALAPLAMHWTPKRTRTPSPETLPPIWPGSMRRLPVVLGIGGGAISKAPGSMNELKFLAVIVTMVGSNFRLNPKPDMPSLGSISSTMMSMSRVLPIGMFGVVGSMLERRPPEPVGLPVVSVSTATWKT